MKQYSVSKLANVHSKKVDTISNNLNIQFVMWLAYLLFNKCLMLMFDLQNLNQRYIYIYIYIYIYLLNSRANNTVALKKPAQALILEIVSSNANYWKACRKVKLFTLVQ